MEYRYYHERRIHYSDDDKALDSERPILQRMTEMPFHQLSFSTRMALPPMTASAVAESSPKADLTAPEFSVTLCHFVALLSSGGKNG